MVMFNVSYQTDTIGVVSQQAPVRQRRDGIYSAGFFCVGSMDINQSPSALLVRDGDIQTAATGLKKCFYCKIEVLRVVLLDQNCVWSC